MTDLMEWQGGSVDPTLPRPLVPPLGLVTAKILIVDDDNDLRETLVEQLALYEEFTILEETTAAKGVQAARSLQQVLARDDVQRLLDPSLVGRAQRRLTDFLSVVRGLQFLSAESPSRVNSVLAQLVARVGSNDDTDAFELLALADDRRSFLDVLTRRLAARSPLGQVTVDLVEACQESEAAIALNDSTTSSPASSRRSCSGSTTPGRASRSPSTNPNSRPGTVRVASATTPPPWSSTASASRTDRMFRCSTTSPSSSDPPRSPRSSACPVPANPRWRRCSHGSTTSTEARSVSSAATSAS